MQSSLVVAQILGPMYVIVAVGLLLNPPAYQRIFEEFFESPALAFVGGVIALIFGLAILAFHRAWSADWTLRACERISYAFGGAYLRQG